MTPNVSCTIQANHRQPVDMLVPEGQPPPPLLLLLLLLPLLLLCLLVMQVSMQVYSWYVCVCAVMCWLS